MFKFENKDNNKLYSLKPTDEKNILGGAKKTNFKKIFNFEDIKKPLLLAYGGPSISRLDLPCGQKALQKNLKALENKKTSEDESLNSSISFMQKDETENEY